MLLHTIYLIAIVAEAMSGAIMGMRRDMDLFGICVVGTITALVPNAAVVQVTSPVATRTPAQVGAGD